MFGNINLYFQTKLFMLEIFSFATYCQ